MASSTSKSAQISRTEQAHFFRSTFNREMKIERNHSESGPYSVRELEEIVQKSGGSTKGLRSFLHRQPGLSPVHGDMWVRTKTLV